MQVQQYEVTSHMDGLGLSALIATPEKEPVGIVQILHGMAEHKDRYLSLMECLCEHGYVCVIHDHRGHGDSVRSEEDYGYFYEGGKEALIEDAHQVTRWIKEKYPQLPLYLIGHSMGSLIARCYTKKYDAELSGLILIGSPSNQPLAGVAKQLCKTLMRVRGGRASGDFYDKVSKGVVGTEEGDLENGWLSYNEENVKTYNEDKKCGFVFTLNGYYHLYSLMEETYSKKGWQCKNKKLPVFFLSGEDDPYMGERSDLENAILAMRKAGYKNTKAKVYPHMKHEILQEEDYEQVHEDILTLLKRWEA